MTTWYFCKSGRLRISLATVAATSAHLFGAGVFSSTSSMLPDMSTRKMTRLPVRVMPAKRLSTAARRLGFLLPDVLFLAQGLQPLVGQGQVLAALDHELFQGGGLLIAGAQALLVRPQPRDFLVAGFQVAFQPGPEAAQSLDRLAGVVHGPELLAQLGLLARQLVAGRLQVGAQARQQVGLGLQCLGPLARLVQLPAQLGRLAGQGLDPLVAGLDVIGQGGEAFPGVRELTIQLLPGKDQGSPVFFQLVGAGQLVEVLVLASSRSSCVRVSKLVVSASLAAAVSS